MKKKPVISFPHLGNYSVAFNYFFQKTTKLNVQTAPIITKKTIEIGSKYSPDFVCLPFKYNLGNFIEALDQGANLLVQAGGGCRYGCYAEVQEQILKDLGYDFEFLYLMDKGKINILTVYRTIKKLNKRINFFTYFYYLVITMLMIIGLDKLENYIRLNIGFEVEENSFKNLEKEMLKDLAKTTGLISLITKYFKYRKRFHKLKIVKPKKPMKIGIIGELYTSMEQFSSYFIEESLAKYNIEVKRFTNLTYLLIEKRFAIKKMLKKVKKYVHFELGADGLDNVARAKYLIDKKYDGIIHIKPFGCTPEIGAIPIIDRVCKENKMPIIYFSFDSQTSDEGIKTRLEALVDMLEERKKNNDKMFSRNRYRINFD